MEPDFSRLDALLDERDADGYLVDDTSHNSTQKYLSGFDAHDPFVSLYTPERTVLLVSALEYGRARKQSRADEVRRMADYGYRELAGEHGAAEAKARVQAAFLDEYGASAVLTPERYPLGPADGLRRRGVDVEPEESDRVTEIRAAKTDEEIAHVRAAQEANEAAMRAAETLIADADVEGGTLVHGGDPLTSERVKEEIEVTLLRRGCGLDDTIVACGADAADPHDQGSGPLRADEAVIVDIFPRSKATGYHADMTRTFLKGEPSETIREWFEVTDEAREAALDAVEPGVTGADVHDVVCDIYEAAGHDTLRSNPTAETGFIHSTGHGVGLDVHELPRIAPDGEELKPGHVITIEPGLYDPSVGGVRIEDIVVVTEGGYENLTDYPVELVV